MIAKRIYHSIYSILLPIGLAFTIFLYWTNDKENENIHSDLNEKQKGAHIFSIKDTSDFQIISEYNFNWLTVVPWGFQDDIDSPNIRHHNGDSLNILSHDSAWVKRIELVRERGYKVFVKPHIWVSYPSEGMWRSDIFPSNEENWEIWKENYRDFILRYAKVAETAKADMFCIGTELSRLSISRPKFWRELISEIKTIYSGKITYAANWYNEYEKITFWDQLDFIGIQAYFPLVTINNPTTQQLSKGWKKYIPRLKSIHKKYDRRILFTEIGYKSTASSAIKPWEWLEKSTDQDFKYSPDTQANCYKAFFESVWPNEWFAGVHIWQLRSGYNMNSKGENLDFTPQGKLAEEIIVNGFNSL